MKGAETARRMRLPSNNCFGAAAETVKHRSRSSFFLEERYDRKK